jgi:hypothetical protein
LTVSRWWPLLVRFISWFVHGRPPDRMVRGGPGGGPVRLRPRDSAERFKRELTCHLFCATMEQQAGHGPGAQRGLLLSGFGVRRRMELKVRTPPACYGLYAGRGQATACRPPLMTPGPASPAGGDGHDPLTRQLLLGYRRLPDEWKPAAVQYLAQLRRLAHVLPIPPATNQPDTTGADQ